MFFSICIPAQPDYSTNYITAGIKLSSNVFNQTSLSVLLRSGVT